MKVIFMIGLRYLHSSPPLEGLQQHVNGGEAEPTPIYTSHFSQKPTTNQPTLCTIQSAYVARGWLKTKVTDCS